MLACAGVVWRFLMLAVLSRGLGAVAVASTLVFAVPVSAQAFEVGQAARVFTLASGGVAAASPGVLAASATAEAGAVAATAVTCAASVICGGAVLAIAVGTVAYATKDTWVPWVKSWGPFSAGGPTESGAGTAGYPCTVSVARPDGVPASLQVIWTCGPLPSGVSNTYPEARGPMTYRLPNGGGIVTASNPDPLVAWHQGAPYYVGGNANPSGLDVGPDAVLPLYTCPVVGCEIVAADLSFTTNYISGNPAPIHWAEPTGPDPADSMVTTNKVCQRPDGSTYTDARSASNVTDNIPVGFCLPGDKAISLDVVVTPAGGAPIVTQTIPLTPSLADVQAYPLCAAAGCEYQILLDGVPCKVGMLGCSQWAAISQATPGRVTGRYGPYEYAVNKLAWLTHAYDSRTGTKIGTTTATGGQEAGEPAPEVGVSPPGFPAPEPLPPGSPLPDPQAPPVTTADCMGADGGMGLNPINWVMRPVQCALSWAFVPSTGFYGAWGDHIKDSWDSAPFGRWLGGLAGVSGGVIASMPSGGGCQGPGLPTGFLSDATGGIYNGGMAQTIYPWDACSGVMANVALTSKAILTLSISFFGGMRVVQQLGYAFGFKVHVGSELRGGGGA